MQKIMPCLWFDNNAEDAAKFYASIFPNSRITHTSRFGDAGPGPKGAAMTVMFEIEGQKFMGLNGGPQFKFNEAISFVITCDTQVEIDNYWSKLQEGGGQPSQCGWLKDRFGLSWQVVPKALGELMQDKNPEKSKRVMEALLKMTKLDIAELKRAYDGEPVSKR